MFTEQIKSPLIAYSLDTDQIEDQQMGRSLFYLYSTLIKQRLMESLPALKKGTPAQIYYQDLQLYLLTFNAVSLLKKKIPGSKGQFSRMHLAVYPFQVEFLTNIEYKTCFQFQKNFQIIGQTKELIPMCQKGSKYQIKDPLNLIYFKLFSSTNVVYKWSVYMKHSNGEEEYLQSCTLNLKQLVYNFIIPQKSVGSRSHNSLIELGFNVKQMRLKFPKTGVILMFMLFVSDEISKIKDHVDQKILKKSEENILFGIPSLDLLHFESNMGSSVRKYQHPPSPQKVQKKKSLMRIKSLNILLESKQKSNIKKHPQESKSMLDSNDELGNLIMSFDAKETNKNNKVDQFLIEMNLHNKLEKLEEQNQQQHEVEKKLQTSEFGMLKLQSDQGRLYQEQIDKKLQLEQLQAIDEERTSKCDAPQSQSLTPLRQKKQRFQNKQTPIETKQQFQVEQKKFNLRKVLLITLLSLFLFLVGIGLSKNVNKKDKKNNRI